MMFLLWPFHINAITLHVTWSASLFSLSMMFSGFILTVAGINTSLLLWLNNIPLCRYTTFCLRIYSLVDISVVHILTIRNNVSMNVFSVLFGIYLGVKLSEKPSNCTVLVFHSTVLFLHSYQQCIWVSIIFNTVKEILIPKFLRTTLLGWRSTEMKHT